MAIFEIQGPDGKVYEVEAPTIEQAASAVKSLAPAGGGSSVNPQAAGELAGNISALGTSIANGASFGFGDNIAGVIGGVDNMVRGRDFGSGYDNTVQMIRDNMAYDDKTKGGMTTAGNIIGASIPAAITAPIAGGSTLIGTMGRGGVIGAAEGGLQGAGNANGQDVVGQTLRGAAIGGFVGAAAPAVVAGGAAVKNAISDPVTGVVDAMLSRGNATKANRAIASAMRASGKAEQEIIDAIAKAAREGQPEYRLMDALGIAGQRQASGVARSGGDAGTEIANFLERRQMDQGDRVGSFIDDAFGTKGTTAEKTRTGLKASRKAAADPAYEAARAGAGPVNLTPTIETIDGLLNRNPILGESALGNTEIGKRLLTLRGQMQKGGEQLIDFDTVLNIKQDLGNTITALKASGKPIPPQLAKVADELDAALEASSDGYRAANDGFREASRVIDAVDTGATMATRGRAADNVPQFSALSDPAKDAARVGYGDTLLNKLEAVTSPTSNRAKPLQSTKRTLEADAMTLDPVLYRDRLARENEMWNTQNRALGGSRTADNEADKAALEGLAGGALDVARSAGNFQFGDAVAKIAGLLGPIAKGQTDQTRQMIARILMSDDPQKALAPVLRQALASEQKKRVAEALLRQPFREGGMALGQ